MIVAKTDITSTVVPIGPSTLLPKIGRNVLDISPFSPLRN